MIKRKVRKSYVPIAGPMLPWTVRKELILNEIETGLPGCPGIPVNIKWCIQLNDRSCQKSKDLKRLIKEGICKIYRTSLHASKETKKSGKYVSYVVKA